MLIDDECRVPALRFGTVQHDDEFEVDSTAKGRKNIPRSRIWDPDTDLVKMTDEANKRIHALQDRLKNWQKNCSKVVQAYLSNFVVYTGNNLQLLKLRLMEELAVHMDKNEKATIFDMLGTPPALTNEEDSPIGNFPKPVDLNLIGLSELQGDMDEELSEKMCAEFKLQLDCSFKYFYEEFILRWKASRQEYADLNGEKVADYRKLFEAQKTNTDNYKNLYDSATQAALLAETSQDTLNGLLQQSKKHNAGLMKSFFTELTKLREQLYDTVLRLQKITKTKYEPPSMYFVDFTAAGIGGDLHAKEQDISRLNAEIRQTKEDLRASTESLKEKNAQVHLLERERGSLQEEVAKLRLQLDETQQQLVAAKNAPHVPSAGDSLEVSPTKKDAIWERARRVRRGQSPSSSLNLDVALGKRLGPLSARSGFSTGSGHLSEDDFVDWSDFEQSSSASTREVDPKLALLLKSKANAVSAAASMLKLKKKAEGSKEDTEAGTPTRNAATVFKPLGLPPSGSGTFLDESDETTTEPSPTATAARKRASSRSGSVGGKSRSKFHRKPSTVIPKSKSLGSKLSIRKSSTGMSKLNTSTSGTPTTAPSMAHQSYSTHTDQFILEITANGDQPTTTMEDANKSVTFGAGSKLRSSGGGWGGTTPRVVSFPKLEQTEEAKPDGAALLERAIASGKLTETGMIKVLLRQINTLKEQLTASQTNLHKKEGEAAQLQAAMKTLPPSNGNPSRSNGPTTVPTTSNPQSPLQSQTVATIQKQMEEEEKAKQQAEISTWTAKVKDENKLLRVKVEKLAEQLQDSSTKLDKQNKTIALNQHRTRKLTADLEEARADATAVRDELLKTNEKLSSVRTQLNTTTELMSSQKNSVSGELEITHRQHAKIEALSATKHELEVAQALTVRTNKLLRSKVQQQRMELEDVRGLYWQQRQSHYTLIEELNGLAAEMSLDKKTIDEKDQEISEIQTQKAILENEQGTDQRLIKLLKSYINDHLPLDILKAHPLPELAAEVVPNLASLKSMAKAATTGSKQHPVAKLKAAKAKQKAAQIPPKTPQELNEITPDPLSHPPAAGHTQQQPQHPPKPHNTKDSKETTTEKKTTTDAKTPQHPKPKPQEHPKPHEQQKQPEQQKPQHQSTQQKKVVSETQKQDEQHEQQQQGSVVIVTGEAGTSGAPRRGSKQINRTGLEMLSAEAMHIIQTEIVAAKAYKDMKVGAATVAPEEDDEAQIDKVSSSLLRTVREEEQRSLEPPMLSRSRHADKEEEIEEVVHTRAVFQRAHTQQHHTAKHTNSNNNTSVHSVSVIALSSSTTTSSASANDTTASSRAHTTLNMGMQQQSISLHTHEGGDPQVSTVSQDSTVEPTLDDTNLTQTDSSPVNSKCRVSLQQYPDANSTTSLSYYKMEQPELWDACTQTVWKDTPSKKVNIGAVTSSSDNNNSTTSHGADVEPDDDDDDDDDTAQHQWGVARFQQEYKADSQSYNKQNKTQRKQLVDKVLTQNFDFISNGLEIFDILEIFGNLQVEFNQLLTLMHHNQKYKRNQHSANPEQLLEHDRFYLVEKFKLFRAIEAFASMILVKMRKQKEHILQNREEKLEKVLQSITLIGVAHPNEAEQMLKRAKQGLSKHDAAAHPTTLQQQQQQSILRIRPSSAPLLRTVPAPVNPSAVSLAASRRGNKMSKLIKYKDGVGYTKISPLIERMDLKGTAVKSK